MVQARRRGGAWGSNRCVGDRQVFIQVVDDLESANQLAVGRQGLVLLVTDVGELHEPGHRIDPEQHGRIASSYGPSRDHLPITMPSSQDDRGGLAVVVGRTSQVNLNKTRGGFGDIQRDGEDVLIHWLVSGSIATILWERT